MFFLLSTCVPSFVRARPEMIDLPTERWESSDAHKKATVGRELEFFRTAKVSIRAALAIAQDLHAGSRVVDVSFDGASGAPIYRVKTHRGNLVWEDAIDANSGVGVGKTIASFVSSLTPEDQANLIALSDVKLEVVDAIVVSERNASGRAISGGLANEDGRLNFVIVVVSGNDLKRFILEPPRASDRTSNPRRRK